METELLVIFIGFAAGFIGSFIGGTSSMIALTSLLAVGIPSYLTLSIFRLGSSFWHIGGLVEYFRKKKIIWKYTLPLIAIAIPLTILGTKIALSINEDVFEKVFRIVILIFVPLTLVNKKLGVTQKMVSNTRLILGYFVNGLILLWTGIFPFGGGIFHTYNYIYNFGMTLIELKATTRIPGIISNLMGFAVFFAAGIVDWKLSALLGIGMLVGGLIGAKYTIKVGNKILRYFLVASIIFLVVRSFVSL